MCGNRQFYLDVFLEIDPDRKKLKWVRAGHEPAICYSSSTGNFSHLGGPGVVLGVDESCRYANQTMESLSKGDLLLIGTDGIKEATNMHEEQFGEQLLREILQNNAHESTRKIGEEIFLAVHRYRDGLPQEDDISFVVMKVRG